MMEDNFVSLPQRGTLCVNIVDDDDDDVLLCLFKWRSPCGVAEGAEHKRIAALLHFGSTQGVPARKDRDRLRTGLAG